MRGGLLQVDALLRRPDLESTGGLRRAVTVATVLIVIFGMLYGAVMGMYGGIGAIEQITYSALKVPILFGVTFLICVPSYFVLNTLLGLRGDFDQAVGALALSQAGLTVILASLAPYTALWYCSTDHYRAAIFFNGLMFAVASFTSQAILWRLYAPLIARDSRHRLMAFVWLALYVFVAIQMAWVLRPFIGDPRAEPEFLRPNSWSNAYVAIANMVREVLGR